MTYEEECCEGFERAITPRPDEELLDFYKLVRIFPIDAEFTMHDKKRAWEKFKRRYLRRLGKYYESGVFDEMINKIILLDDAGYEFYFDVLLGFLERKGFQIRVIRKGQERL